MARLAARDLRAVRRAATCDGDGHRRDRPPAAAVPRRSRRHRARDGRDRASSGVGHRLLSALDFLRRTLDLSLRVLGSSLGFLQLALRLRAARFASVSAARADCSRSRASSRRFACAARSGAVRLRRLALRPGRDDPGVEAEPAAVRSSCSVPRSSSGCSSGSTEATRSVFTALSSVGPAQLAPSQVALHAVESGAVLLDRLLQVGSALPCDGRFLRLTQPLSGLDQRRGPPTDPRARAR